eukprot:Gb_29561 [translate_table: standard]
MPSVYLGAYDEEEAAARAYDLAALKYWGPGTLINFPVSDYARDIDDMQNISREEYLASLRRKSSGFSRGMSKYRRMARRPSQNSRWEARLSRVIGNKYFNMGNYYTVEDAAAAYDTSQAENRSFSMVTNINLSTYIRWWQPNKMNEAEISAPRHADESQSMSEERTAHVEEPETPEWPGKPCEPYQLPSLGLSHNGRHKSSPVSALSILFQSSLFKQMLERASARKGYRGQDNYAYYNLGKIRLDEGRQCLISQEEHKVGCKESGCSSGPYQPHVQISVTQVPSLSNIQECNTTHS